MMNSIPFDSYCLTLNEDIQKRICPVCDLYFSSIASMKKHKVLHLTKYTNKQTPASERDDEVVD